MENDEGQEEKEKNESVNAEDDIDSLMEELEEQQTIDTLKIKGRDN